MANIDNFWLDQQVTKAFYKALSIKNYGNFMELWIIMTNWYYNFIFHHFFCFTKYHSFLNNFLKFSGTIEMKPWIFWEESKNQVTNNFLCIAKKFCKIKKNFYCRHSEKSCFRSEENISQVCLFLIFYPEYSFHSEILDCIQSKI